MSTVDPNYCGECGISHLARTPKCTEVADDYSGMITNQECPTEGCGGVDTFYRWVTDTVDSDLDGMTGVNTDCGTGDELKDEFQDIRCRECGEVVA